MEKTKRYCTLISAILSVLGIVLFGIMCRGLNVDFNGVMYPVFGLIVIIILLNIGSFIKWNTTKKNYKKLLWLFIILLIFDFALIIISLVTGFGVNDAILDWKEYKILLLTIGFIYLFAFILMLIDIVQGAKYKDPTANKNKVSRPFTLSAGITSLVIGAALFVVMIWGISELANYGLGVYIPFIMWLNMASSAVVLTFGIITTCLARTSVEKYKRLSGLFLTAFITNSLQALISLIYVCVGGVGSVAGVINLLAILGCVMAATFFMLDYLKKQKADKSAKKSNESGKNKVPRPFTLSAGITSAVAGVIVFVVMAIIVIQMAQYGLLGYIPFIIWADLISSLVVFVFGIITACFFNRSVERYKKMGGLFLTAFILNCLQVLISIIYVSIAGIKQIDSIVNFIAIFGCATAATFFMLDYARKNRTARVAKPATQPQTVQSAESEFAKSLREIKEMKDAGIINDADYEKLKANIIENFKFKN